MSKATERIDILSFYWTLRDSEYEEAAVGAEIFQGLKDAAKRGTFVILILYFVEN